MIFMNVVIITPPLVQLNTPYPSGAYLCDFFKKNDCNASWYDLNIELFYSIFSRSGLENLFSLTENKALEMADKAEKEGDDFTAFNLRRYVSIKDSWIEWSDFIISSLCDGSKLHSDREKAHQFLFSPFAPRGNRMQNYLSSLETEPTVDNVRFLCSYALEDLADYITAVFDSEFSLIRYAEALTVDESSFSVIEKRVDSPVMEVFFKPVLEKFVSGIKIEQNNNSAEKTMICISVPFAGTFVPALYIAKFLKEKFEDKIFTVIGGGFVNTELREANDKALVKYVDAISYDRGYGSYKDLFLNAKQLLCKSDCESAGTGAIQSGANEIGTSGTEKEIKPLYKMRLFIKDNRNSEVKCLEPLWDNPQMEDFENKMTVSIVPDFSDIDFSKYPRVCDDENPMHRLWSDGSWIKAYLAHGCYWQKCAFCDTKLDYVCSYQTVDIKNLFDSLKKTAEEKGIYGIHFVDEALPVNALKQFGLANAQSGNSLYYWGNIRFEKAFTKDTAAFLSYCGLGGVSAGLEVANGEGLKQINKGTDIDSIVSACAAFKEAGVLVHAYMIYGFWYDTPQSIIDSMETLRQFFAEGLLDSAFWHKFVLTKNSHAYDILKSKTNPKKEDSIFAKNTVHFEGEEKYQKYGLPLENALNAWMHGQKLNMKVQKWFDFPVPAPNVDSHFIEKAIERYEKNNEANRFDLKKHLNQLFWLGSKPVFYTKAAENKKRAKILRWIYLQEEEQFVLENNSMELPELSAVLWKLRPAASLEDRNTALKQIEKSQELQNIIGFLHYKGIVFIQHQQL